jgi:hypothetical protein
VDRTVASSAIPAVDLQAPAQVIADAVMAIKVSTNLPAADAFYVDVDLNHDGEFRGPAELAYAAGVFTERGVGTLRHRRAGSNH